MIQVTICLHLSTIFVLTLSKICQNQTTRTLVICQILYKNKTIRDLSCFKLDKWQIFVWKLLGIFVYLSSSSMFPFKAKFRAFSVNFRHVGAFSYFLVTIFNNFSKVYFDFYFLGFSRVVTLISLLAVLKETCSPNKPHIYQEQGYIPQKCNGSKVASKSVIQLWRNRGSIIFFDFFDFFQWNGLAAGSL